MANKQFNSVDGYSVGNANVVIDSNGNISGNAITATANITAPQIISNVATGTAPLVVSSTTQVANLNAATAGTAISATNAAALLQNTSTATTVYPMFTASSANGNSSAVFNTSIVANLSNASISATTFVGRLVGNVANGTSTISIPATNGNINLSSAGNANILVVTGTGANITGTANVTGNLAAGNISANIANFTTANITGNLAAGNITTGTGTGGNISGANVISANLFTGTLTTSAQPNITSVGTLTGLTVNGNITLNNTASVLNANSASDALRINQIGTGNALVVEDAANPDSTPFVVSSDGNVSIGGTTPTNKLQVVIPDSAALGQGIELNTVGNTGYFRITGGWSGGFLPAFAGKASNNSGSFGYGMLFNGLSGNASDTANGVITFSARDNAGTANVGSTQTAFAFRNYVSNLMVIMGSGNVGMGGNIAPAHTVSINGTLNASGNANVGNIGATNGVFTNVSGNGQALASITGANVTGQVANSLVSGTVYTAAQPNITSVGTLTSLTVSGTSNLGPVSNVTITGGSNGQVLTTNGSGVLSWSTPSGGVASISNGTSNVNIATSGGNITMGVGGVANVVTVTSSNVQLGTGSGGNISGVNVVTANTFISSVATGVSAAGTTQGTATGLTAQISVVSTVASGAGVRLPAATPGMRFTIMNTSANALLVYPATNGIINSQAANAAYSQPAGARLDYISTTTTQWYTLNATYG